MIWFTLTYRLKPLYAFIEEWTSAQRSILGATVLHVCHLVTTQPALADVKQLGDDVIHVGTSSVLVKGLLGGASIAGNQMKIS